METPPPEPRRSTRSALMEMSQLSINDPRGRVHANIMTNLALDPDESNVNLALLTPAPSPDELVIQARGRRRLPVTWSPPDMNLTPPGNRNRSPTKDRTPVKQQSTIVTRSTPRKRLLMPDPSDSSLSPDKKISLPSTSTQDQDGYYDEIVEFERSESDELLGESWQPVLSPNPKKVRIELPISPFQGPIENALKALSHDQLISMFQATIARHPFMEDEIRKNLPAPDLRPIKEKLTELKRNIYKSLPNSRLTSKTDSPAYNRAATHLLAFKKAVLDEGRHLVSSMQWESVIEFVVLAWELVSSTPLWDNPPHNAPRRQCFKFLANQCMNALKKIQNLPVEQVAILHAKFLYYTSDSEDINACVKYLDELKKK